jgi:thiol:disulfide interchange protein
MPMNRTASRKQWMLAAALAAATVLAGCKHEAPPAANTASAPAPSTPEARKAAHQPAIAYTPNKNIYPMEREGPADLKAALLKARREHKRVILDFGGDWCGDCQVLDIYFHQPQNAALLDANFVKVNVNIGHQDANVDIAHRYGVPLDGVPALAVLDSNGKLLFSQNKEFSDMRYMDSQSVTDFLNKWKS